MRNGTALLSLFLFIVTSIAHARDYLKALLSNRDTIQDPATFDARQGSKKDTMGQCLSGSTTQEIVQDVLQAAAGATAAATTTEGGVYDKLPNNAERVKVRNVYDGDTLTLIDERRVRLLGIDTPEIKERQPFAQEAKAYTKDRCHKKEIWISFDGDREDHYGRLLAFVWVQQPDGRFLNVNEGIVAAGFARVYAPKKDSKLKNWKTLLKHQTSARQSNKGVWKDFKDETVYKTANGSAYHKKDCEHVSRVRHLTPLKASDAITQGLHPCRTCHG